MSSLVEQCWCWWRWIGLALKHCHSRWDHLGIIFCRKVITTSGIRRPSWNFWGKEMSRKVDIYTVKTLPPKHRYSHWDRVDICSIAKLLVLPVLVTVSTSDLHRIVLCLVGQCRCWCRWIGDVTKHRTGRTGRTGAKYRSWVLVKCVWCGAYYWIRLRKATSYGFHAFLTCILLLLLLIQCKISLYFGAGAAGAVFRDTHVNRTGFTT